MVTLEVNGKRYGGWKTVRIERSIENIAGSFNVEVSELLQNFQDRPIKMGDAVTVRIDSDVVITGYVDEVNPSITHEDHSLQISGRDKTGDLVDCSAMNNPGQWVNQKLERIATELASPFGIKIIPEMDTGEVFKKFNIQPGETAFEAIQRMCKLRAILCVPDGKGNLLLTRAQNTRGNGALILGQNVLKADATFSSKDQFSEIKVKGQTQGNDQHQGKNITEPNGKTTASDGRYRPLLLTAEGQANHQTCQERAEWESAVRNAKSVSASVTVQGWRQNNGQLWSLNQLVFVDCWPLRLKENLLISALSFSLDDTSGTTTTITLARPDAFKLMKEQA